jgi:hypothetical protein
MEDEPVVVEKKGKKQSCWVPPLFSEEPTVVWDRSAPILRATFVKEYGLCNTGIPPKSLKINVHITEDKVVSVFGQKVGGSGYKYTNCDDESLVKKVELRWMICHQRTSLPNTRLINISEA